jgi:hypothetical protein
MTKELRDVTEQLKNLTQDTVDDSFTVKVITYVSAFYLPGSFVAVSCCLSSRNSDREGEQANICSLCTE